MLVDGPAGRATMQAPGVYNNKNPQKKRGATLPLHRNREGGIMKGLKGNVSTESRVVATGGWREESTLGYYLTGGVYVGRMKRFWVKAVMMVTQHCRVWGMQTSTTNMEQHGDSSEN